MRQTIKLLLLIGLAAVFMLSSCSRVANAVVDGAVGGLSRAASERAANAVYKKMAPKEKLPPPATPGWNQFMAVQAQVVFNYAFAPGGLWISRQEYQPGEFTKFKMSDNGEESEVIIEKAFLKKLENGNEWWRASWKDGEDTWIYEALLSPSESSLLRLRAKDAEGNEGEVPVTQQNIYMEPTELTEESIEGAKVGEETISTPVGSFNTDHIRYVAGGGGTLDWWLTPQVPGGVAKYQMVDENEETAWIVTLVEKGDNATTILESF